MQMETAQPFGKYLLLECVAVGGMAEIFRAKTVGADGFEKEVAIKRILPSYSEDEGFVTMFKDEAKIAAQLDHPNIVRVFDFDEVHGDYYIAMELIRGTDLKRLIESADKHSKRFTPTQIAHIIGETAKALDYAHKRVGSDGNPMNIVHRDATPHNIMVCHDGAVKLMDFGIAKAASRATKTRAGTVKGKCAYMSPEQARGKPLDGRSDMFSIGIILWEMLTGRRLFSGGSDFDVLSKVLKSEIPNPRDIDSNIPEELARITMRVLNRDRDMRHADCGEFLADLNTFIYSQPDASNMGLGYYVECLNGMNGHSPSELPEYIPGGGSGGGPADFSNSEEATQMLSIEEMEAKLGLEADVDHGAATQALDIGAADAMAQQQQQMGMHPGMQPGMHPGMQQPGMHYPTGMMPHAGYAPHPSMAQMNAMMYMQQQQQPKSKAGMIIGIIVVLLILGGGGAAAYYFMNKKAPDAEAGEGKAAAGDEEKKSAESVVTISTIPPGAVVKIDGVPLDSVTPIYGHKAPRGSTLSMTFELDGYEPLVITRQLRQPSVSVEEILKKLESEDEEDTGDEVADGEDGAEGGEDAGGEDGEGGEDAEGGEDGEGEATLVALVVESKPSGSSVTIEGVEGSWTTPATIEELPSGKDMKVTISPKDKKLRREHKTVNLDAEDMSKNTLDIKHRERRERSSSSSGGGGDSEAGGVAKLTVTAIPWGQVYLDGEALGTTPVKKEVASGKHKLEILFPARRQRVSKKINLKKGGKAAYTYDFTNETWK